MPKYLRVNFGFGFLTNKLTIGATQMTLSSGHYLPVEVGNFRAIIWDAINFSSPIQDPNMEIVTASYVTTNIYNIVRGEEGTIPAIHNAGNKVAMTYTAGLSEADLFIIGNKEVDESTIADNYILKYSAIADKLIYVPIPISAVWGNIIGTLSEQTDLQSILGPTYSHILLTNNPHLTTLEQARLAGNILSGDINLESYKITTSYIPVNGVDLVNKTYVDNLAIGGLTIKPSVIDFWDASGELPSDPTIGDRYVCSVSGNGWTKNNIYQYNGATWDEYVSETGWLVRVINLSKTYMFDGDNWVDFSSITSHEDLSGLQGGVVGEHYHLTNAQHTIAVQVASATLDGYLTSEDWSIFNAKQDHLDFPLPPSDVGLGDVTNDAQLKRSANDFASFTEKTLSASADLILIEDSAASGAKKKVQIGNFPLAVLGYNYIKVSDVKSQGTDGGTFTPTPAQVWSPLKNVDDEAVPEPRRAGGNGKSK